jgi:hypothetical protein
LLFPRHAEDIASCSDCFLTREGRDALSACLSDPRNHQWNLTFELDISSFESLQIIINKFLDACMCSNDFNNPRLILGFLSSVYKISLTSAPTSLRPAGCTSKTPISRHGSGSVQVKYLPQGIVKIYMAHALANHPLWQSVPFWSSCLSRISLPVTEGVTLTGRVPHTVSTRLDRHDKHGICSLETISTSDASRSQADDYFYLSNISDQELRGDQLRLTALHDLVANMNILWRQPTKISDLLHTIPQFGCYFKAKIVQRNENVNLSN